MKVKELLQNLRDCDSDMEVNIAYNGKIYRYIELYADDEAVYIEGYTSASNTTSKYTQQRKQSYSQTFYTVNDLIADLNECDTNATVVLAINGALSSQITLYTDEDYLYIEGYSSSIKSSKGESIMNIKCNRRGIKADFRDNTIDKDAVRELVLVITNDGDQYRRQITPAIENLKKKYKKGTYDRDLAVKLWQYVADEGVRRYNKEYGSGTYSVAWLNPATRKAIAEELRDYYEDEIMYEPPVEASTRRRPITAGFRILTTYQVEGEFADGFRYTAQGDSEAECVETLGDMQDKHGELVWYSGSEDEYYTQGRLRQEFEASTSMRNRRPITAAEGLNGMKIIVKSKAYVDITRDDYEQGALDYVNQWDFDVRGEYDDIQSLIDKISVESYVFSSMLSDYYFLDGALHTSATVNNDNEIPTESEIELWKRGEENLYIADLYLPLSVGSVHGMTEDEASAFGLDIY